MTWTRSMAAGRIRERDNDIVYRDFDAYNICFHTRTHCCYLTHICTWTPLVVLGMVWNMECRMEDYWRFICRCGCGWGISHKKNMILFSIRTWIIIFCYYFWEYDVFASMKGTEATVICFFFRCLNVDRIFRGAKSVLSIHSAYIQLVAKANLPIFELTVNRSELQLASYFIGRIFFSRTDC